jgi:hypothetical protein
MMLASIRARGLRGLIDLPKTILLGLYLRRLGKEFAALIASLDLGALPPLAPTPPDRQAGFVYPAGAQPAGPGPASRAQILAASPALPAKAAGPRRAPQAAAARPVSAAPATPARRIRTRQTTRHQAFARPRRAPDPRAIVSLRPSLRDTTLRQVGRTS